LPAQPTRRSHFSRRRRVPNVQAFVAPGGRFFLYFLLFFAQIFTDGALSLLREIVAKLFRVFATPLGGTKKILFFSFFRRRVFFAPLL